MASTYSTNLKIELIGTGDQSGTWGTTTNTNLGTLLEEAIAGYTTQAVADSGSATVLTIPDGATSVGRHAVIEFTGALTANRTVEVPAVDKTYVFFNNTSGGYSVTVKVSGQTGVAIAAGKKAIVYVNSVDVIEVINAPVTETSVSTLTNKTLTAPVISTISNSGTITLPTGTRTLVARDTTDTLTNKTLTTPVISTIVNTGTLTLPTSTDTLVGRATTDTLTNKTLTSPTINTATISGGTINNAVIGGSTPAAGTFTTVTDSKGNVRDVPQNARTGAYVLVASDAGKHISITTGGVTVNSGIFNIGETVTIYNNSSSNQTITQGASVTIRQVGTSNTGSRTLAGYGLCTLLCVASNTFVITGGGVS